MDFLNNFVALSDLDVSFNKKIHILKCVKIAILKMHSNGIIHADLHNSNIMYSLNRVRIIDFDNSFYKTNRNVHLNKYATEYLNQNSLSKSLDIFVFNITTLSFLYNIAFDDVFEFDFTINLDKQKDNVWQKTKKMIGTTGTP